jgi:hypothetical protein
MEVMVLKPQDVYVALKIVAAQVGSFPLLPTCRAVGYEPV